MVVLGDKRSTDVVKDVVYYLEIEGEFYPDECFETEAEALEYAEEKAMNVTNVVEWDVG